AYRLWQEVYRDTDRPSLKQAAFQHVHDLKVELDLSNMQNALNRYHLLNSEYPLNLQQLVAAGLVKKIPKDPEGDDYLYEPGEGGIRYSRSLLMYKRYR